MPRTAPVHPSKLTGQSRALHCDAVRKATSLDTLREAASGAVFRLVVDYGEAYVLLTTGHAPRRGKSSPKLVEVVFVLKRLETFGRDHKIFGSARWPGYRAPAEIRLTRDNKQRALRIGAGTDRGGVCDDGWIVGQVGDIVSARLDLEDVI